MSPLCSCIFNTLCKVCTLKEWKINWERIIPLIWHEARRPPGFYYESRLLKKSNVEISWLVQWLGFSAFTAGRTGSIPGWGTRILKTKGLGQKNTKKVVSRLGKWEGALWEPTCVEDGSKVSFKEKHDRARAVIGIQEGDRHGLSSSFI